MVEEVLLSSLLNSVLMVASWFQLSYIKTEEMAEEVTVIEPKPLMGARGGARGGPMGMKRGIFLKFVIQHDSPGTVFFSYVAKPAFPYH